MFSEEGSVEIVEFRQRWCSTALMLVYDGRRNVRASGRCCHRSSRLEVFAFLRVVRVFLRGREGFAKLVVDRRRSKNAASDTVQEEPAKWCQTDRQNQDDGNIKHEMTSTDGAAVDQE